MADPGMSVQVVQPPAEPVGALASAGQRRWAERFVEDALGDDLAAEERLLPTEQVIEIRKHPLVADDQVQRRVVDVAEPRALACVADGRLRDVRLALVIDHGVLQLGRMKDVLFQELRVRLSRRSLDDRSEHGVTGVAVFELRAGLKFWSGLPREDLQRLPYSGFIAVVGQPSRARPVLAQQAGVHQELLVVGHAGEVVEQVSDRDLFSPRRELREEFRQRVVVAELSLLGEDHDRQGRERLGD